ncbi:MAG: PIG-L family deacetylase [Planctomycetes bacterium]|nr:PIG-L family deacetylase [Planctomycetota bacterium]
MRSIRPLPRVWLLALAACATAPTERTPEDAAFRQACRDATTDVVALNLAAHPDDEAARTLVYLRRKFGIRTVTVYSTCGEGGQNAIGPQIGIDLARIRTRETLAAAAITGTEVRWLGFADFGYSKSAAEAFAVWGRERYLERLRSVLEAEQPDLVFTNHSSDRGHGHHRASYLGLRAVLEAQARAGHAVPLYVRAVGDKEPWQVKFEVGKPDDVTGLTYSRQAYRGWRQHRTQGTFGPFTVSRVRPDHWRLELPVGGDGRDPLQFTRSVFAAPAVREAAKGLSLDPDALESELAAFGTEHPVAVQLARAHRVLPVLERLASAVSDPRGRRRLARRIDAVQRIVLEGHGVEITAALPAETLAAGSAGFLDVRVGATRGAQPTEVSASLDGRSAAGQGGVVRLPYGPLPAFDAEQVAPSWLRPEVVCNVDGVRMTRRLAVPYTPVPQVSLAFDRTVCMVPAAASGGQLSVGLAIGWHGDRAQTAALRVRSANGVEVQLDDAAVQLPDRPSTTRRTVHIRLPQRIAEATKVVTELAAGRDELLLRPVDVRIPESLRVGLVRGPDDTLRTALRDLRIEFTELGAANLVSADLSRFTTLVLDMRVGGSRPDLAAQRDRILAFCSGGGRVLCFYHKPAEWNATAKRRILAPYPLEVGVQRVCEETAAVKLLDPNDRLWTHPNRIRDADFVGWVQERALNLPETWDAAWQPVLEMADAGEKPRRGALLRAEYGKGDFLYCSLALYRQLREGHAGAARLLVNLMAR